MLKGADELARTLQAVGAGSVKEAGAALYQESLGVSETSQRRTPVLTGALRASHDVSKPDVDDGNISVTIRVGGVAAPYAIPVHENLNAFHKYGQAKFLESAVIEIKPTLLDRLAKRIDLNRAKRGA